MKTETANDTCKNCKQGYTREGFAAYPDHVELCPLHAAAPELLQAAYLARKALKELSDAVPYRPSLEENMLDEAIAKAEGR